MKRQLRDSVANHSARQGEAMKNASSHTVGVVLLALALSGCQPQVMFVRDDGGVWKVFRMRADGSAQQNVSPSGPTMFAYPDVSPDGNRIAYTDGQRIFVSNRNDIGGSSQVVMSTGTGRKTFLRWSPDQLTIAYTQFISGTQAAIWLADATGASSLQVTFPTGSQSDGFGHDFYLSSAGAQYLIYSRNNQLYSMYFNGTQPATQVLSADGISTRHTLPAVSPNNKFLAYRYAFVHAALGTIDGVHVVDIGTWQSRYNIMLPTAEVKQGSIAGIAFSCNSKRVFVAAESATGPAGMREVYSVNLDGTDLRRLTNNSVFDSQPNAVPRPCWWAIWPFASN